MALKKQIATAKEPFYKSSWFIAIGITVIILISIVLSTIAHPQSLEITLDQFEESYNTITALLDDEIQIISISKEDAHATAKISETLGIAFFLVSDKSDEIESLTLLSRHDSGIDGTYAFAAAITAVEQTVKLSDAISMVGQLIDVNGNHSVASEHFSYKHSSDSDFSYLEITAQK